MFLCAEMCFAHFCTLHVHWKTNLFGLSFSAGFQSLILWTYTITIGYGRVRSASIKVFKGVNTPTIITIPEFCLSNLAQKYCRFFGV